MAFFLSLLSVPYPDIQVDGDENHLHRLNEPNQIIEICVLSHSKQESGVGGEVVLKEHLGNYCNFPSRFH